MTAKAFTKTDVNYVARRITAYDRYNEQLEEVSYRKEREVLQKEQDKVVTEVQIKAERYTESQWEALLSAINPELTEAWCHNEINAYPLVDKEAIEDMTIESEPAASLDSNSRTFLYSRVSTLDQETSNQLLEAKTAGYTIPPHRVISESISGSTETSQRPLFQKLIDRLETGDTLVVSRLDRLGRDAINVQSTIKELGDKGIRVVCLNLGNTDLTSPSGRLMVTMLSAVAQLERDLIIERTKAGLARAKAEGKALGRPKATNTTEAVQRCKAMEWTQQQTADHLKVSVRTVKRHWS